MELVSFRSFHKSSLEGKLILSSSLMKEMPFYRSVILLIDYNENYGTEGVILNLRTFQNLDEFISLGRMSELLKVNVFFGGPCNLGKISLFSFKWTPDGMYYYHKLNEELALEDLKKGNQVIATVGNCFWKPGVFEKEVDENMWVSAEMKEDFFSGLTGDALWQKLMREKGGIFRIMAKEPSNLSLC